jgi:hypothetical protein
MAKLMGGDELRDAAQKAYEETRTKQAFQDPPEILPAWEELPLPMRIAMIHICAAGRRLGAEEEANGGRQRRFGCLAVSRPTKSSGGPHARSLAARAETRSVSHV